jgi:hypothetical protein
LFPETTNSFVFLPFLHDQPQVVKQ